MRNRRQFLRDSARIAAGVFAAPIILPASALGRGGSVSPSERVTLGLIGIGKQGFSHLYALAGNKDVQILAVCDVWSDRLEEAKGVVERACEKRKEKGSYRGCAAYGDFREIMTREDIDAVLIATPDHWHAPIAMAGIKANKDVYCEKPLTRSIGEARALAAAARRYGCVFQTGSQQRSGREFRLACEMVRNGRIGRVHTIHVNVGGPPELCDLPGEPVPQLLDWDMWLGPSLWRPYHHDLSPAEARAHFPAWRKYWNFGGGGMTDWGAHHFDIAQWALGMDGSAPIRVHPPDGAEFPRLTYEYEGGVAMIHGGGKRGVDFRGENGNIVVDRGFLYTDPEGLDKIPIGPEEIHLYESTNHHANWLECIQTRKDPICTADIGGSSATVCHLGNICYRLNRPLSWDNVQAQFLNDDEANALVNVPMRSPWHV